MRGHSQSLYNGAKPSKFGIYDEDLGEDVPLPELAEGDLVALVGVGGYCQSMWTDHCGRPRAGAIFFEDRA
jgi:hypothetical protein